jgi:hypothetical protein
MIPPPNPLLATPSSHDAIHLLRLGLQSLPDGRLLSQVTHHLDDVLLTALFAMIADCEDDTEMALFAQTQLDWLR